MSVDLAVSAPCGCYITSLSGRANVAMCRGHSARMLPVFDGRPDEVEAVLVGVYGEGLQRVRSLLEQWDRLSKGEPPTTAPLRAAIAGTSVNEASS
jgi:hypothetical protein